MDSDPNWSGLDAKVHPSPFQREPSISHITARPDEDARCFFSGKKATRGLQVNGKRIFLASDKAVINAAGRDAAFRRALPEGVTCESGSNLDNAFQHGLCVRAWEDADSRR